MSKVLVILCFAVPGVFNQIWDSLLVFEDELDDDIFFDDDNDENSTSILKLVHLKTADILNEKDWLEESSDIIIDEVSALMENDLDSSNTINNHLSEIISEHTVQLYNVISQINSEKEESSSDTRLSFNDIFIWSNESEDKIKDILEDYYRDS